MLDVVGLEASVWLAPSQNRNVQHCHWFLTRVLQYIQCDSWRASLAAGIALFSIRAGLSNRRSRETSPRQIVSRGGNQSTFEGPPFMAPMLDSRLRGMTRFTFRHNSTVCLLPQ